ncbi:transporter [Litorivita pollutaquae]|uniref:Transporter n=1 Tax=Litorivita pollutaquae TaxID=2200892 RepID=A0A2V4MQB3_9RHOB|nr:TolC family protein [Litorivita pollutaquae]PYC48931.1 transporter [Litorivita pollutaquae]
MRHRAVKSTVSGALYALLLSGCVMQDGGANGTATMMAMHKPDTHKPEKSARAKESAESAVIAALQARRSALPSGSSYDQVAANVLAASSRSAEAELRSARLRAEAQSKNWLPSIGPSISLSSLGAVVAGLLVEQVLFDNGRKKAERDFAKADVEVAAATLSIDTNDRVYEALSLYISAEEGRAKATLSSRIYDDMKHFEWIMNERVTGGVSDMSDLQILRQKLSHIKSEHSAAAESVSAALAELNAMSARPLGGLTGLSEVAVTAKDAKPLSVLKAEAERARAIAEAKISRAGHLPGAKLTATAGTGGSSVKPNISVGSDNLLGLGTGASLKAIAAEKEAAARRVAQAQEDANRRLRALEQRLAAQDRQAAEAATMTAQAKANLDIFQEQYEAGQRQVMDVVGVFETFAAQQRSEVVLKYKAALTRLEIAKELGLLANGEEI